MNVSFAPYILNEAFWIWNRCVPIYSGDWVTDITDHNTYVRNHVRFCDKQKKISAVVSI